MKLKDLKGKNAMKTMPLGKHEVTFAGINYRINEFEDIIGAYVKCNEYHSLYIPVFDENNYQLDLLCEQLGVDSYDPDEMNKAIGTVIIAHKYTRFDQNRGQEFTNISFNPRYDELKKNQTAIFDEFM